METCSLRESTRRKCRHKAIKKVTFRPIVGSKVVNQNIESVPWPQPNLGEASSSFVGTKCFATPDLSQGFWQVPMDEEGEQAVTIVT